MPLLSPAALLIDEVARVGSIRRAAERLNISASAVNRQVLNLEAEMGVPFFERLPRGVRLTAAGELMVTEVRRWRREQDRARGRIQDLRGLRRGHASIGVMECFVADLVPRAIARLQERYARIEIQVQVGGTKEVFESLAAGTIEAALCFNPPRHQGVNMVFRLNAKPGLLMAKSHPLAKRKTLRLTDCAPYTFVLPDHSLALRAVLDRALKRTGIDPSTVVTTNSTGLMKMLVRDSQHVTVLGGIDVYTEIESGKFAFVPIVDEWFTPEELALCVNRQASLSAPASLLVEIVREELTNLRVAGLSVARA
jgi:DNA-binding transcriptional LysR family regulator